MGVARIRAGSADLLRCRFAVSPLWETVNAARAFRVPRSRPYLRPWWLRVRDRLPAPSLLALHQAGSYVPDFVTPPPSGPSSSFDDELAQVRHTPPDQVAAELARCRDLLRDPHARSLVDDLLSDPATARHRLADAIAESWEALVRPWWPRLSELLDADIAHRSRLLARHGLGHVIADLDDRIRWQDPAIHIRVTGPDIAADLGGSGIVLMPSAFTWPNVAALTDPPWQPTLIYPVRGVADLFTGTPPAPSTALARLLGHTRARLLTDLAEPTATTTLAARHHLSPSTVSAHLSTLHAAGLLTKHRQSHEIHYHQTPLARSLLNPLTD